MVDPKKFKNGVGAFLTKQLFFENCPEDKSLAVYSLKGYDHTYRGKTYPSLRRLYIECGDPTEYQFATTHLGGWEHWKAITAQNWFASDLASWREELEVKLKSEALLRIKVKAQSKDKDSLSADKILLSGGWEDTETKREKVGRPTKQKIKEEASKLFKEQSVFDDDFKRLNIQ